MIFVQHHYLMIGKNSQYDQKFMTLKRQAIPGAKRKGFSMEAINRFNG
jgi:hypothetical protein